MLTVKGGGTGRKTAIRITAVDFPNQSDSSQRLLKREGEKEEEEEEEEEEEQEEEEEKEGKKEDQSQ